MRNGISAESGLLESWPAGGPKEVWRVKGGIGMSGLSIARERLLTMVQKQGKQFVVAYDAKSGALIWQTAVAPEYANSMGDGPRATPTLAGDSVIVFTGEGILASLNFNDGKLNWSQDVVGAHGGKPADYGMACSPLVIDTQVIVTIGGPNATVIGCDLGTGKTIWSAGNDPAGYSSPALLEIAGRPQLVVYSGSSVMGIEPGKGTVLWRHPYQTDFDCNIATPVSVAGQVFVSSGENHGCVLLGLKPVGSKFEVHEVWASQGAKSVLRNEWQTSVLLNGYLYGFDNVGSAGPVTHLTCINAATGERVWQQLRFGKGNLIAADGKLFISTMKGELAVVRASPTGFEEIGRKTVIGATRNAPSLARGLLYLRDGEEIVCLDVRK